MIPSVLIRKSTKEIIKHALYPRAEITPFLEGEIDPDYEWLIEYIPYTEPDYDSRIYLMVTNLPDLEALSSFPYHPEYPEIKAYQITYTPEKRSKEDIIISINNAEKEANSLVWSEAIHKDKMMLMLAASNKKANGQQLNSIEQANLDEMDNIAVKISKNLANKNLLISQVNTNQEPNIDLGWENA